MRGRPTRAGLPIAGLLTVLAGSPAAAGPAFDLERLRLELADSRAQSGATWEPDFRSGETRHEGLELGCEAAGQARGSWWEATLAWRGWTSEHGPTRGRFLAAQVGAWSGPWRLELGRGYPAAEWVPCDEGGLLFSHHAPPLDHVHLSLGPFRVPASLGTLDGEGFLAYLDDGSRPVPHPLLSGMRLVWTPRRWVGLEAQRSIMFGGEGRTEKLTIGDLWDILIGRGEGAPGPVFSAADSDQKFAWLVRLRPREWVQRHMGWDDLELVWFYGGEDRFEGLVPMAPGRFHGLRIHPAPHWGFSLAYVSTADDQNRWYYHKIYRTGYTLEGYIIGHPLGGDARRWRLAVGMAPGGGTELGLRLTRERRGYFWSARGADPVPEGGFFACEVVASACAGGRRVHAVLGAAQPWGGDMITGRLSEGYARIILDLVGAGAADGSRVAEQCVWGFGP